MLLNGLGFVSAPLYLFGKFFQGKATEQLLGKGVKPEPGVIEITYGYSRDHRPDLKQLMMNLICVGDGDIPVLMEIAKLSKSSMGWYYGFKLHLIINDCGEILSCKITPGNVDDRTHLSSMTQGISGKIFGDKGYIKKELFEELLNKGLQLITPLKSNMKNKLILMNDKISLRKRSLIETVNDRLKNISYLVHSRHRSLHNFMLNLITALIAYTHQPKKPRLKLDNPAENFFSIVPI